MDFMGFPKIPRYSRECIITEKIDGTNAQVYIIPDDELNLHASTNTAERVAYDSGFRLSMFAGSRTKYITPANDNHGFARWVQENSPKLFQLGPGRHYGEWWGQGINRGYGLKEKRFSLFNIKKWEDDLTRPSCCYVVPVITRGIFGEIDIPNILRNLEIYGSHAAPGYMKPEGIIIYHVAGNLLFKKTIFNDEEPKNVQRSG
jgi:hypothetical protein